MSHSFLNKVRAFFNRNRIRPVSEWYFVTFDDEKVYVRAEPPHEQEWALDFRWDQVIRICFQAEDMWTSDGIYVYTSCREASYAIPSEASGGSEFWDEIIRRGLFDAELAIKAMSSTGGVFIWPPQK